MASDRSPWGGPITKTKVFTLVCGSVVAAKCLLSSFLALGPLRAKTLSGTTGGTDLNAFWMSRDGGILGVYYVDQATRHDENKVLKV